MRDIFQLSKDIYFQTFIFFMFQKLQNFWCPLVDTGNFFLKKIPGPHYSPARSHTETSKGARKDLFDQLLSWQDSVWTAQISALHNFNSDALSYASRELIWFNEWGFWALFRPSVTKIKKMRMYMRSWVFSVLMKYSNLRSELTELSTKDVTLNTASCFIILTYLHASQDILDVRLAERISESIWTFCKRLVYAVGQGSEFLFLDSPRFELIQLHGKSRMVHCIKMFLLYRHL